MRLILIFAIMFVVTWNLVPAVAVAKPRILLTAFEPFDGSDKNRSMVVAERVLSKIGDDVDVEFCLLPVEFDRAAVVAKKCYEKMNPKPAMVVSLGERQTKGVDIETAAHNMDNSPGMPDNSGLVRAQRVIDPKGPRSIGFGPHVVEMYCSISSFYRGAITVSSTPGGYVCNNAAYLLARYFEAKKVPFSFIHVPLSSYKDSNATYNATWMISDMIRNVPALGLSSKASSSLLQSLSPRMPVTAAELDSVSKGLSQASKSGEGTSCYEEFYRRLGKQLAP